MTYTLEPGHRVTSPLLVGEWAVLHESNDNAGYWWLGTDWATVCVWHETLTPVAPPLPPEPAVGSVVRAQGQLWLRTDHTHALHWADGDGFSEWCDVAAAPDLSPVVAVDDVADWLDSRLVPEAVAFLAEFGWKP